MYFSSVFIYKVFLFVSSLNNILPLLTFKDQRENTLNLFSLLLRKVGINVFLNIFLILLIYFLFFVVVLKKMFYVILSKVVCFVCFLVYFFILIFVLLLIIPIVIVGIFIIFTLKVLIHEAVVFLIFYPLRYHTVHNIVPYPINLSVNNLTFLEIIYLWYGMSRIMKFWRRCFTF